MTEIIELNGRRYLKPDRPIVVICVDGCDPRYIDRGIADGVFPFIGSFARKGHLGTAEAVVPTFTNPNNVSIVTGAPPAVHGISGNYYLDRETGREIMMTDESLMRSETILALMARAGVKTAAITAKDKLRKLLGRNLDGICFSSECADREIEALVGRGRPGMYSADLSLFVLDAGIALLDRGAATLLYLSLSDYVQHAHAPGAPEADGFNRALDDRVRRLVELGAVVGIVADHGMNDKAKPDGAPNVIFLEDELNGRFGDGSARVICPITDPFVRHHGALGSFVRGYARNSADIRPMMAASAALGVEFDPQDPGSVLGKLGGMSRMIGAATKNTTNPTGLKAGYKVNVIPQSATAEVDGRFLPGHEEEFFAEVDRMLGTAVKREFIHHDISLETTADGDLYDAMSASLLAEDPQATVAPYCLSAGTDAKWFSQLGVRCFGFSPLKLPPELDFSGMFHGIDERVAVDGLRFGVRVLDRFLDLA